MDLKVETVYVHPSILNGGRLSLVESAILLTVMLVVSWATLALIRALDGGAPLTKSSPPHHIPLHVHRKSLRFRLTHLVLDRQIPQELAKLRIGLKAPPPELTMVRAMALTRMDDFGYEVPMSVKPFSEGIRRALQDVWGGKDGCWKDVGVDCEEEHVAAFGGLARLVMVERAVEDVSVRLRIHDYLSTHPEAKEIELPPIIIVTGLPDCGSAEIRDLLSLHPSLKVPTFWELSSPVMPTAKQDLEGGWGGHGKKSNVGGKRVDPRHRRTMQFWDWAAKLVPDMKSGGPLGPDRFKYMGTGYFDAIFPELHSFGTLPMPTLHTHSLNPNTITQSLHLLKDLLKTLLHQDATRFSSRLAPSPSTASLSSLANNNNFDTASINTLASSHPGSPPTSPGLLGREFFVPTAETVAPRFPSALVLEGEHHLPHLESIEEVFGKGRVTVVWVHRDPVSCGVAALESCEAARAAFMKPLKFVGEKTGDGRKSISTSFLDNRTGSKATLKTMEDVLGVALEQRKRMEKKGTVFVDVSASEVWADPVGKLVKGLLKDRMGISAEQRTLDKETEGLAVSSLVSCAASAGDGWRRAVAARKGVQEAELRELMKVDDGGKRGSKGVRDPFWFEERVRGVGKGLGGVLERFGFGEEMVLGGGFREYVKRFGVKEEWERDV
ncbi:hypothetical protein HDU97_002679 [Phlyctochytrium planicorne]|nr:hypothetical protein HDU97_002679 [Phlyctochytrium planicorne]